jgi:hypothetical protein
VLLVAEELELDTSWFDLKNYEALKTKFTIKDWIFQLEKRCQYHEQVDREWLGMIPDEAAIYFAPIVAELKAGVIPDDPSFLKRLDSYCSIVSKRDGSSTASVNSVHSIDLWRMSKESRLGSVWDACQHAWDFVIDDDLDNGQFEIACTPHELNIKKYSRFDRSTKAYVAINLSATDAQIKKDFEHWLRCYRKETGHYDHVPKKKSPKKLANKGLYTQKDFDEWIEYGVIPYLDIVLIAKIQGKEIPPYHEIGRLLFPALHVDCVGRVRDTTKPTAEWLIKSNVYRTLWIQLASENVAGMKNA